MENNLGKEDAGVKKEYVLIKNETSKMMLSFDDEEFDFYTDVYVKLFFGETSLLLLQDKLLALRNIMGDYDIKTLDDRLNESKLGIYLNDYYRGTYEGQYEKYLILDKYKHWIGERYYCMQSMCYTTWLYQYEGNIILKVTPVFDGFLEDDFTESYRKFAKNYKDTFRQTITLEEVVRAERKVFDLYEIYFGP